MSWRFIKQLTIPNPEDALPGRSLPMQVTEKHFVSGASLEGPWPDAHQEAMFGLGCFWGAERKFWSLEGIHSTSVGYAAGYTPNPNYKEVCTGETGHNEVVHVVYDPTILNYETLLLTFWNSHNPTQGMQQGNDTGTQYRSGVYYFSQLQKSMAESSRDAFQPYLTRAGFGAITTEVLPAPDYYYAEDYHQQYLAKNPDGYCGLGGTGVECPRGIIVRSETDDA